MFQASAATRKFKNKTRGRERERLSGQRWCCQPRENIYVQKNSQGRHAGTVQQGIEIIFIVVVVLNKFTRQNENEEMNVANLVKRIVLCNLRFAWPLQRDVANDTDN